MRFLSPHPPGHRHIALGLGTWSAGRMLERFEGADIQAVGPWHANRTAGSPTADPYSKARLARTGDLTLWASAKASPSRRGWTRRAASSCASATTGWRAPTPLPASLATLSASIDLSGQPIPVAEGRPTQSRLAQLDALGRQPRLALGRPARPAGQLAGVEEAGAATSSPSPSTTRRTSTDIGAAPSPCPSSCAPVASSMGKLLLAVLIGLVGAAIAHIGIIFSIPASGRERCLGPPVSRLGDLFAVVRIEDRAPAAAATGEAPASASPSSIPPSSTRPAASTLEDGSGPGDRGRAHRLLDRLGLRPQRRQSLQHQRAGRARRGARPSHRHARAARSRARVEGTELPDQTISVELPSEEGYVMFRSLVDSESERPSWIASCDPSPAVPQPTRKRAIPTIDPVRSADTKSQIAGALSRYLTGRCYPFP